MEGRYVVTRFPACPDGCCVRSWDETLLIDGRRLPMYEIKLDAYCTDEYHNKWAECDGIDGMRVEQKDYEDPERIWF